MSYSRKSRDAEAFDTYRRELMRRAVPVAKTARKEWEEKFKEFVESALPEQKKMFQKPGLATRLFSSEIELVDAHERDLEAFSQHIDLLWEASFSKDAVSAKSLTSLDRRNFIWEFALETAAGYVTGCIKLRTTSFERPGEREFGSDRPERREDDRPPSRSRYPKRDGDRPGYGGERRERPSGGGYRERSDRPSSGGSRYPKRDGDRPSGGSRYPKRDGDRPSGGGSRYPKRDGDRPSGGSGYGRRPGGGSGRPSGGRPGYKRRPKD